jgi:hypothetical protein
VHLQQKKKEKKECLGNKYDLTDSWRVSISDRSIMMIGPVGLPLVVSSPTYLLLLLSQFQFSMKLGFAEE